MSEIKVLKTVNDSENSQSVKLKNLSAENARLNSEYRETAALLVRRELELAECRYRLKSMTAMYEEVCTSLSWASTAPIRKILDKAKRTYFRSSQSTLSAPLASSTGFVTEFKSGSQQWLANLYSCPDKLIRTGENDPFPPARLEILYVYKIASFGGVERVLLNRAEAFKRHNMACRISLFFYEDEGALARLSEYIMAHALESHVRIVTRIDAADYDYVFSIDTPEALNAGIPPEKLVFECHTTYQDELIYLSKLPDGIRLVAVPSESARRDVAERVPALKDKLVVVRNFIPGHDASVSGESVIWKKRPLLYLGRLDDHKNYREVLDIFQTYRELFADDLFLLLVGPVLRSIDLPAEISRRNIGDSTVLLPPVAFDRAWHVYEAVKQNQGIFVSSSMAESFGLSAAEALTSGLPVLLSGISAHIDLVAGSMANLYPLGDAVAGAGKLRGLIEKYDRAVIDAETFGRQFSEDKFVTDWQSLLALLK